MNANSEVGNLYQQKEEARRDRARRPVSEKLAVAEKLRDLQKALAPVRAANKAKRASEAIEIKSRHDEFERLCCFDQFVPDGQLEIKL
jgi:hypothetical protein